MSNTFIDEIIRCIVSKPKQRITFAEYMNMVLYHPQYGYYSQEAINIGKKGDFFTSVHLGADFGEMLAIQFVQMWYILGQPVPFMLVEIGAGQGYLAADILNYLQKHHNDLFSVLEYTIIEKSLLLKQVQQHKLQGFSVNWCDLKEIKINSIVGCIFSNELIDAFPVHQFVWKSGHLKEVFVGVSESVKKDIYDTFVEIIDEPSTPELSHYFDLINIDISIYPDGYRSEINLAALNWLIQVADKLQCGYVITIDYGYPAHRYYNPRRSQGTLQCYYQHRRHDNPYMFVGKQDITTHVNFTALERWGEKHGLVRVGFTQQSLFLMALGLGERIAALSTSELSVSDMLRRRDSLHQLLDPMGLGDFGVLVQSKGLTSTQATQPLKGLTMPF
ncbi:MAG: class I SAM-dependent methyltransferase [Calothrix sp. C42_A2020_038]|nr:class I SAM-dependent methyltransferase [Calothrix sp. C42_A2020_038]